MSEKKMGETPAEILQKAREVLEDSFPAHVEVGQCWCGNVYIPAGAKVRYGGTSSRRS